MADLSLFLPLTKIDAENRLVYGVATAESPDRAGEVCDYASTKPFYEKWSGGISKATDGKSFGNLRAMHGKVAAGKLTAISFNDDAKQIEVCAKVVDDAEWRKVEEGVYTGFSQGGGYAKRWKDESGAVRYTADPSEISLVDLPCLPSATFQVLKADGAAETKRFAESVRIDEPAPPSNDAVLEKAAALATEAGRDGQVGDFIASAREALVKAAEADGLAKARAIDPPSAPAAALPVSQEASPALGGEVEQVWKAKDGTTFAKKADALAHNATADAEAAADATTKPVLDALADLSEKFGVEKSNSNHGSDGRFASGDGGGAKGGKSSSHDGYHVISYGPDADTGRKRVHNDGGFKDEKAAQKEAQRRESAGHSHVTYTNWVEPLKTSDGKKVKPVAQQAKKGTDGDDLAKVEDGGVESDLEKTLYGVSRLACLLAEIKDLQTSAAFDAAYTGEASDVPARIKAWAVQGVSLLGVLVEHEMDTLVGSADDDAVMALAAGKLSDDAYGAVYKAVKPETEAGKALAKIGARNSKSDSEKIQAMHDHARDLGADCKGADKAAGGDLAKGTEAIEAVRAELAKITGERNALQKTLNDEVLPQIAALAKLIGDQPVPKHLVGRVVEKNREDRAEAPSADDVRAALEKMAPEARADLMIKLAQQNPQQLSLAR